MTSSFSSWTVRHGPWLLTEKSRLLRPSAWGNCSASPTGSRRSMAWCRARSAILWAYMDLYWWLSRHGNLHSSGMSHAMTASPKPSSRAPWRMDNAAVSRETTGQTTSKSGCPCPRQNYLWWPPTEKTGRGSLLSHPLCPTDDPIDWGTELTAHQDHGAVFTVCYIHVTVYTGAVQLAHQDHGPC